MNKIVNFGIVLALTVLSAMSMAQTEGVSDGRFRVRNANSNAVGAIVNASIMDGRYYFCSSDMMYSAALDDRGLTTPEVDLALAAIDPQMNYVVRHPVSGELYFTKVDVKGIAHLYSYEEETGKVSKVKVGRYSLSVCHPVFSSDGTVMVFSSDNPIGFGGYDLWYSTLFEGKWQEPQNMGRRINTAGNEIAPTIANGFLFFSSDAHEELLDASLNGDSTSRYHFFASRLVPSQTIFGDTIVTFPIGKGVVQPLMSPFNDNRHNLYLALDSMGCSGVWISRLSEEDPQYEIDAFWGRLDEVELFGTVKTPQNVNRPTAIEVFDADGNLLYATQSQNDGSYKLLLQPRKQYAIKFSHRNCFPHTEYLHALHTDEELLYSHQRRDIYLSGFILDYWNESCTARNEAAVFATEASCDLTNAGKSLLQQAALFLNENPHIRMEVAVLKRPTGEGDGVFCALLNEARVESVKHYLASIQLNSARLSETNFYSYTSEPGDFPDAEGCADALLIRFVEK